MRETLLYITSTGIGENVWGIPTIKFLNEKYDLKILCDNNKKNFNFLNKFFPEDKFIFCSNLDRTLTTCFFKEDYQEVKPFIPSVCEFINNLSFDLFVYNRWQFNVSFKDKFNITPKNLISYKDNVHSMWNPRHETLFQLCGGDINEFNSFYEKAKIKTCTNKKHIVIYQGSIHGGEDRKISKEFIKDVCNSLLKCFNEYIIYIIQNEDLNITDDRVISINSKNHKDVYELMLNGVDLFISPDSGLRWFSQMFEIKNILISEHPRFNKTHLTFKSLIPQTEEAGKDLNKIITLAKKILL